jgi:type III restriction enzyme
LRRTSYAVNPQTGLFEEETAQIFGVPFELIPFKVEGGKPQPPSPPANHVYADPDRSEFEIDFPVVEGYQDPGVIQLKVNWDQVGYLSIDPNDVPDEVLLRGLTTQDGNLIAFGPGQTTTVSLAIWRSGIRVQQVAFQLARVLAQKWKEDRGDAIPMQRVEIRRKLAGRIKPTGSEVAPRLLVEDLPVEFVVPKHREGLALVVIVCTGKRNPGQPAGRRRWLDVLDQPVA